MEQQKAEQLVLRNLKSIFGFAFSRLYDKSEAETLAGEIVCAVLQSAHRLQNDDAFYGFLWKIADNTFKTFIRKKKNPTVSFDASFTGVYLQTPESECIQKEEMQLLRRELALLTKQYRETTVLYYFENKTCAEIADRLHISVEMVKYYLFQTRKKLKEGIAMTRTFGEKSYRPGVFRMDFWGGGSNECYYRIFKRKLPGNILLAAYDRPVTVEEMAMELGVSAVYLEDEIELLLQHELIQKQGKKYQTNIIIFTGEYETQVTEKIKPLVTMAAQQIDAVLQQKFADCKALQFRGREYNDNRLRWTFANLAMLFGLLASDKIVRERFGDYPPLSNGSYGFVFGYDNDYAYHHFNGIYGLTENKAKTAYFSVENYRIIEKCQRFRHGNWEKTVEAVCDAILQKPADPDNEMLPRLIDEGFVCCESGRLSANFPVFSDQCFQHELYDLLKPATDIVCRCMQEVCTAAAEILKGFTPPALKDKCGRLAFIHHQVDVMAFIMETLVNRGSLTIPDSDEKLCMFGVVG